MPGRPEKLGLGYTVAKGLPWLDTVAKTMEQAFDPVLGQDAPRGPRDFLYGTWLGHSLHAAVIPVAAGAAVTGAAQWQDTTNAEAPRRLGALHALLNVAATGLRAGSWLLRRHGRRGSGVTLSTLGLGINLASAWLGGELAYELGIGVNHAAFESPPTKWTEVAALDDLPEGKPQRVEAKGTPVLLLRQGDRIRAIGATCPHLGGPLDEGPIEGNTVTCPWHGSVFCLNDGTLIHGPAMMPVAAYEVRVKDGRIAIRANAEQPGIVLGKTPG